MAKYLLTLAIVVTMISCDKQNVIAPSSRSITVILDHTDPFALKPQANPILALYHFADNENQSAIFRLVTITDKRLNPSVEYNVPDGLTTEKQNTQHDPQFRKKLIVSFYNSVRGSLADSDSSKNSLASLQYSECYRTIAHEIILLTQSNTTLKDIIIYSDIQEKSDLLDGYSKKGQELLSERPQEVINRFNKAVPMPKDLDGMTAIFVYKPQTREQDKKYYEMEGIYRQLLESRGAKVIVQAQSDIYTP